MLILAVVGAAAMTQATLPPRTLEQIVAMMAEARAGGRAGVARKNRPVDARPAKAGEVVVSLIKGEGKETQSRPARAGDWVVRNRCPETGNEQYLVAADKFGSRYEATGRPPDAEGWQEFRPLGEEVRFLILGPEEGSFSFVAPWGEKMVARPGDAIVQSADDEKDVYRVARSSFECTYEVVR
jgi:hypothetical protein